METINLYGAKGGVGTTTVAAILATTAWGTLESPDVGAFGLVPDGSNLLHIGSESVHVIDHGVLTADNRPAADGGAILVTTACYIALRRVMAVGTAGFRGIILLREDGRALTEADVSDVLDLPVLVTLHRDPAIARAVDSGLLTARLPREAARMGAEAMVGA